MKLEVARWRTLISTVRLGRDEYRVVRPAKPSRHASMYITDDAYRNAELLVDKVAARELAMAWELAMRSPRTLVYLPLRQAEYECRSFEEDDEPLLDLVLMHHSLGFPPSLWKEVRARLGRGRPHVVRSRGFPPVESLLAPDYQPLRRAPTATWCGTTSRLTRCSSRGAGRRSRSPGNSGGGWSRTGRAGSTRTPAGTAARRSRSSGTGTGCTSSAATITESA
ncbi:hypothetical protein V1227_35545 [Lentzea sp. DG1S-22]|uniref:hypothetical protein n=1 Tax=Lentzea sp. DG1S-22 TaxID=3108822 RepID=UPI002E769BAB|nr:hypothetical protein [Lentzea sp. DG1S-22]WVH80267.1 hypothetical protein V1227_35545 [Lentzea sp. DG1S-22]